VTIAKVLWLYPWRGVWMLVVVVYGTTGDGEGRGIVAAAE